MFQGDSVKFVSSSRSYIQIPLNATKSKSTITFEISFSTTSTAGSGTFWQNPPLFGNATSGSNSKDFGVCLHYGKLYFWAGMPSVEQGWETNATVNDGNVHHVALVSDGSTIDLYCDGVNLLHLAIGFVMSDSYSTYIAVNAPAGSNYADFDLYEFRIWDKALAQAELFSTLTGDESDLTTWYKPKYENGYLVDNTANAYDATPYKCPLLINAYTDSLGQVWSIYKNPIISGDKFTISSNACIMGSVTGGQDFTVECWANCSSITGNWAAIVNIFKDFNTENDRLAVASYYSNDQVCIYRNHSGTMTAKTMVGVLRHYAAVYKHSTGKIYFFIDGEKMLEAQGTFTGEYYVSFGLSGDGGTTNFRGYFEQPEISYTAKWTDNFTPPAIGAEAGYSDTLRLVSCTEIGLSDTLRIIKNTESGYSDTSRKILHGGIQTGFSDLLRIIAGNVSGYSDTLRITANKESGYSDTLRTIQSNAAEDGYSDTLRCIANNTVSYSDTLRIIAGSEVLYSDTLRVTANIESGYSDTLRDILHGSIQTGYSDLLRIVNRNESGYSDTSRNITGIINQDFDAERIIASFINQDFDSERILAAFINQDFDAERKLYAVIDQDFDTEVKIPHTTTISPIPAPTPSPTPTPVPQENTGTIRSISVTLNEQQVTDDLTVEAVSDYDIMELIQGSYLDYAFSMRIESMTRSRGITTARCCSDVDELLYTQLAYNVPQNERWHIVSSDTHEEEEERVAAASTHIAKIAAALGKVPVLQFSDFISTMDVEPQGVTYADLIRELFGWTSSLPQMLINCYIRNDRLYVIQRGYEQNQIDLTNSKRTAPTIARELVRTTWGSDVWSKTETKTRDRYMWDKVDIEFYPEESGERNSEYTYDSDGLVSSSVTLDETSEGTTKTEVYYHYTTINKRKFLSHEETIITYNSGTSNEETETRHVYHTPLNNGQEHVHGVDSDGEPIGSNVGNKAWNDKVSPYSQYLFAGYAKNITKTPIVKQEELQRTLYGISLIDTSFPVVGNQKLIELTNAIKWLNRKTMETVEFSVYDHPHLIDFNDRIVLDGNVYYLQSNSAIRDTRNVNKQNLRIVRWY